MTQSSSSSSPIGGSAATFVAATAFFSFATVAAAFVLRSSNGRRQRPARQAQTSVVDRPSYYIGFDCSTQSMTAVVIDQFQRVVAETTFRFDERLPHYGTNHGVIYGEGAVVIAPSLMFIEALDEILSDLAAIVDLNDVCAISGCAQQHGSCFWNSQYEQVLGNLDASIPLAGQVINALALSHAPIWMDSSTSDICRALEKELGGPQVLADLTGSRAYERFTGHQIAKHLIGDRPIEFSRISLLSSMLASVLIGKIAPIDQSDASGMNLMDIRTRTWSPQVIKAVTSANHLPPNQLREVLGDEPVPSSFSLGPVAPYFVKRFGFRQDCRVISWTGDNPCTLAGLGASAPGDVCISLGTSDTILAISSADKLHPSGVEGHIFASPTDDISALMAMVCFKNGSLAREDVRDRCSQKSWTTFASMLSESVPGNNGTMGFFFPEPEITPSVVHSGIQGFDQAGHLVDFADLPSCVEVRAVIEGQVLSMRSHSSRLGIAPKRLIVTGGASTNRAILQVISDVFNVPVWTVEHASNTAALGAAIRAHGGHTGSTVNATPLSKACEPRSQFVPTYKAMFDRFLDLEEQVVQALS